jgi:hypothetical protein
MGTDFHFVCGNGLRAWLQMVLPYFLAVIQTRSNGAISIAIEMSIELGFVFTKDVALGNRYLHAEALPRYGWQVVCKTTLL